MCSLIRSSNASRPFATTSFVVFIKKGCFYSEKVRVASPHEYHYRTQPTPVSRPCQYIRTAAGTHRICNPVYKYFLWLHYICDIVGSFDTPTQYNTKVGYNQNLELIPFFASTFIVLIVTFLCSHPEHFRDARKLHNLSPTLLTPK